MYARPSRGRGTPSAPAPPEGWKSDVWYMITFVSYIDILIMITIIIIVIMCSYIYIYVYTHTCVYIYIYVYTGVCENTFLLCQPLPCNPETALQPLIFGVSKTDVSVSSSPAELHNMPPKTLREYKILFGGERQALCKYSI